METNYVYNRNIYKVLLVIECTNNGVTSQIAEFGSESEANVAVMAVNNGEGTGVEGQLVRAVRLY